MPRTEAQPQVEREQFSVRQSLTALVGGRAANPSRGTYRSLRETNEFSGPSMNNDDAQAILIIVILLVCLVLVFVPLALFFVYVFFQTSKRKRIREKMLSTHRELVGNRRWLPARYASQPRFDSWFKIFPWEGAGIVVLAPGSVLFLGETNAGSPVNVQFAPANSSINWIGKAPFPNGAVSWFAFTVSNRKEYFSSETGAFVFGSHRSTKELFDEANKSFSGG